MPLRVRRLLIALLLLVAVPLQGIAAASVPCGAPGDLHAGVDTHRPRGIDSPHAAVAHAVQTVAIAIAVHDHRPGHAAAAAYGHDHGPGHALAPHDSPAQADPAADDPARHAGCSGCAPCCTAGLPVTEIRLHLTATPGAGVSAALEAGHPSAPVRGLERPPQPLPG